MRFLFRTLLFIVGPAGPWIFVGSLTVAMGVWLSPSFNSTTSPQQDIPNENLRIELNGRKRDAGEGDLVITFHNSSSVPFLWPHEGTSFLELEGKASDGNWHYVPFSPGPMPGHSVSEKQIASAFISVPPGGNVRTIISTREAARDFGAVEQLSSLPNDFTAHRYNYVTSFPKLDGKALERFSQVRIAYDPIRRDARVLRPIVEAGAMGYSRLPYSRIVSNTLDWKSSP